MTDLPLPRFVTAPTHIRCVDFGHVAVLVDYRTGRVQCLLPAAAARWREAAGTGCLDGMPEALAKSLLAVGLLTPTALATPWEVPPPASTSVASWGSAEFPAGAQRPSPVRLPRALSAASALVAVFALGHAGRPATAMHRVSRLIASATAMCRRPATPAQAAACVLAVRRAAWHSPTRVACLEESAAAVLLLAARRLHVTWCHGVAADPVRLHAWIQTADGSPVAEPPSTRAYVPVLTIGARHQHHL